MLLLLSAAAGFQASAQSWDSSGNGMLKGTYYFREVFYAVGYNDGSLSEATALYGSITFSGTGTYTAQVSLFDSGAGLESGPISGGTYSISASGYGFISNPLSTGDSVYGLVNQSGIFVGSTTETTGGFNDMFVAAPLASPAPTVASFKGTYLISGIDLSSGSPSGTLSYLLQINPDGIKSLGTVTGTAYIGSGGSGKFTQNFTGSTYIASGGAMVVTFPNSSNNVVGGQKYMYLSPDGNFLFGGAPQGFDMIVGVRTGSAPTFGGLYYQAGLEQDESTLLSLGYANLDSYYGSLSASNKSIVGHQRLLSPFNGSPMDYTYSDSYSALSGSVYTTSSANYVVGTNGVRIGAGIGPFLGISVAVPAPSFTGSGVYLNPAGIVNGASSAPFTAQISPGELLTLYGTGLADSLVIAPQIPFPTSLGNVQVSINGTPAPIYYVAPTQVSVVVPYGISGTVAQVQVTTDGNPSNTVSAFIGETSAGIFSVPPGGLGYGAILHQDGTLVSKSSPAQSGETVSVFLTGLGAVSPGISDGAAGPSDTLSRTTNTITADISGTTATVTYAGLAPGLAGLYQANVTMPAGLTAGDNTMDIGGPDSYTAEVLIPIGGASTTTDAVRAELARRPPPRLKKVAVHAPAHIVK
jgi:uncharacterized protein (TIGR03437 family)